MTVLSVMMILAPWVVGVGALYLLLRSPKLELPQHLIILGAGSYVGYILLAGGIYIFLRLGVQPFSWQALTVFALFAMLSLIGILYHVRSTIQFEAKGSTEKDNRGAFSHPVITLLGTFWLMGTITWVILEAWHNPIMAWDAVWVWGILADQQLASALSEQPAYTVGGTHPGTIALVMTWSAFWSNVGSSHALISGPWFVLYLGMVVMTLGLLYQVTRNRALAVWFTAMVMSAPLIESHTGLGGYADLWVMAGLVSGVCLLVGFVNNQCIPAAWFIAALVMISVTFLKNNSVVYTVIVLLGASLGVLLTGKRAHWGYVGMGLVGVGVAYVLIYGIAINLGPLQASYLPEAGQITLGNRRGGFAEVTATEVAYNLWYAWWMTSSFGLPFAIALTTLPIATVLALIAKDRVGSIFTLTAWGLIGFLVLAQFSEYFLPSARPEFDTGLSRASHSVYWLSAMAVIIITTRAANRHRRKMLQAAAEAKADR